MGATRIWILGAEDPEMVAIESLLRECGETVTYAIAGGRRVDGASAYADSCGWIDPAPEPEWWDAIYTVECWPTTRVTHRIDHHWPGDPGYGRPPSEFMAASSLGQVIAELARLGRLPVSRIPRDLVLTAAADHCLGAAYRGECPGVDPDELMRWRVESRARFQGRDPTEAQADIELAREELSLAERIGLHPIDRYGYCQGCGVKCQPTEHDESWDYCECTRVADMRRNMPVPELVEAATRNGISYVSGPLVGPDGRRKYTVSGTPEVCRAWLEVWAPAHGIVDTYGDPARGFAGGYERDA